MWEGLEESPPQGFELVYEALSYTWGSEDDLETVWLNSPGRGAVSASEGSQLPVTRNLVAALRILRYTDRPRTLWADARSIDQSNVKERAEQVCEMYKIYTLAQRVVIWLGPSTPTMHIAFAALSLLGAQVEFNEDNHPFVAPNAAHPEWCQPETAPPFDEKTWEAITELWHRKWFERTWVFQEVQATNCDAIVRCGPCSMNWLLLWKATVCLANKVGINAELRQRAVTVCDLGLSSPLYTISSLLDDGRKRSCLDPKDKIYSIINLMPPKCSEKIQPDYNRSVPFP